MTPSECRREAYRILRDARASMRRSIAEAERLLRFADGHDPDEVVLRRHLEELDPEFFTAEGAPLQ